MDNALATDLVLGDFTFNAFEIPESIPFGGSQQLITHRYPGGARSVQAMGRDDAPIGWSGLLFGDAALTRAHYLDTLRIKGQPLSLTYHDFDYTVVIEKFEANLKSYVRIPYSISLLVVADNISPTTVAVPNDLDASVRKDNDAAQGLGDQVGDSTLTGLLNTMDSAIKSVSDFATATTATIQSVVGPVMAVVNRVNTLVSSTAAVVNSVVTLGGILPNNPLAQQVAKMTSQVTALTQFPLLVQLGSVANRIQGNLGGVASAAQQFRSVVMAGGTLYDQAAKVYGDATKWTTIAKANNMTDPVVTSIQTIKVPVNAYDSEGVMSA